MAGRIYARWRLCRHPWTLHRSTGNSFVMAGPVPAIHVFSIQREFVDARYKAGHDEAQHGPID
jgi:hypothetical protein